jgi:glycosyltransferase involved in cell wall biosynthesis/O-antigen/teichoic acid export membrane protein
MTPSTRDSGSRVAVNTASAWIANGTTMVIGFFLTPFLLAHLGDRVYGVYAVAASIAAWTTFVGMPIGTYASRYATEHFEMKETNALNRTLATSLGLAVLTAAFLIVPISLLVAYPEKLLRLSSDVVPAARSAILILGVFALLAIVVRVWESTVTMSRSFYLMNVALMASRLVGAAVVVGYFWWVGPSLTVWLVTLLGLPLLLSICFVIPRASRGLPARLTTMAFDREEIRRAVPFVLFLAVGSLGVLLFDNTDALVITGMPELGLSHVAAYDIGARWWRLLRPLIEAFVIAVSPALITLVANNDRPGIAREVISRTRHSVLIGMIPVVGFASVGEPFITHWVGAGYVPSALPVMWVTLASVLLWAPGMYASRVSIAISRIRMVVAAGIGAGVLNLLLSIGFVRYLKLGLLGVAGGTLISVILCSNIFMGLFVCRSCGITPGRFFREAYVRPACTLAVLLTMGWGATQLWIPSSLLQTVILLALLAITFCPIVFALGLTTEEQAGLLKWMSPRVSTVWSRLRESLIHARRNKLIELMIVGPGRRAGGPVSKSRRSDARIKVLFFESGRQGGSVFRLLSIITRIDRSGFDVGVVSFYRDRAVAALFEVSGLFCRHALHVPWYPQPDAFKFIFGVPVPTPFGVYFFLASLLVLWRHRPHVAYMNSGIGGFEPAILAARLLGVKIICHLRMSRDLSDSEVRLAGYVHHLVVSSKWGARFYQNRVHGRAVATCVYEAIDLVEFDARAKEKLQSPLPEGPVYICQVGSLISRKRPRLAIEAFQIAHREFPKLRLLLAGEGPLHPELDRLVRERGLQADVLLLGPRRDIPALLRACHIGLLLSVHEGLPNSILEYMASSLSIVVVRLPFIDELIHDQKNGLVIDDPTPQRIADAILACARSAAYRARLGRVARATIEAEAFRVDREARDIETVLTRVTSEFEPEEAALLP